MLWAAARPFPDPRAVISACDAEIDYHLFARAAVQQWVSPLVWRSVTIAGCGERLGAAAATLRADAAKWSAKGHFLAASVEAAVTPLMRAGLEPVILKGAALAERYPEPSLRPIGDIDLLLPAYHHNAALTALGQAGWKVLIPLDRLKHETVLAHPDHPTLTVELHRSLDLWSNRMTGLDSEALWKRRRPSVILGTNAFGLEPEDELIFLAAHAGKPFHCFDRMMWFADLVVVIEGARPNGGPDWDLTAGRAVSEGCSTVLGVALSQAGRLGAEVPGAMLRGLPSHGWRKAVLAPILGVEWPLAAPDPITRRQAPFALSDTWSRRLLRFLGESRDRPLLLQPILLAGRLWRAAFGLPRLQRKGRQ